MILWICFALLTALAVGVILVPLSRDLDCAQIATEDSYDHTVYRDQLSEIENDRKRGLVSAEAAQASRAELARRILSHVDVKTGGQDLPGNSEPAVDEKDSLGHGFASRRLVYAVGAFLPLLSVAFYTATGSPGVPGHPHVSSAVKTPEQSSVDKLVAQVEARLRDKPQDGRGWDVLAPVYARLGMFEDARIAYGQALGLLGPSKERLIGLGRTAIRASGGVVTEQARLAFEQHLKTDPSDIESQLWLARAKEQDGDIIGAVAAFEAMLSSSKPDAKWRPMVEKQIAKLRAGLKDGGVSRPANITKDSSVVDRKTVISGMNEEEKAQFISKMVERLAMRLSKDGGTDFEGWKRLVNAYVVLGRIEDAKRALADARERFGRDEVRVKDLDALAKKYELGS